MYCAHQWDGLTPVEETLEALDTLVQSGKVRYLGCSNFSGWQTAKSLITADRLGYQRYVSSQIHYSLQARDAKYQLLLAAIDQGLGVLVWSPLAGGLLSGKFRRGQEGPDQELLHDMSKRLSRSARARRLGGAGGARVAADAPGRLSSLVIGARTEEQLSDNLACVSLQLTQAELGRLEQPQPPAADLSDWAPGGGEDRLWRRACLLEPFVA